MGHRGTLLIILLGLVLLTACAGAPAPPCRATRRTIYKPRPPGRVTGSQPLLTQTVAAQRPPLPTRLWPLDTAATATTSAPGHPRQPGGDSDNPGSYATATTRPAWPRLRLRRLMLRLPTTPTRPLPRPWLWPPHDSIQATGTAPISPGNGYQPGGAAPTGSDAVERERRLQPLKTYGPWFIGVVCFVLLAGLGGWVLIIAMKAWDARQRVIANGPFDGC